MKLEELREFDPTTRATWTGEQLVYSDIEQPIVDAYGDLIAFGQTLYDCEQTGCDRYDQLLNQFEQLEAQYLQSIAPFQDTVRDNRYDDEFFQDPDNLSGEAQALLAANPHSVLIYPFVTEEKLWLLYATAGSVGAIDIDVTQETLARLVQQLGESLTSNRSLNNVQVHSQALYDQLIKPLEAILPDNEIQHLIFVNDRVTRYIPMAALFDGERYLIERYAVSSVLSAELTDTQERLDDVETSEVLGVGLTQAVSGFSPLPSVADELDGIIRSDLTDAQGIYPGQIHLDEAFSLEQLKNSVSGHNVLHVATHAEFVPGRPDDSYILLANGEKLTPSVIDTMGRRLQNLHMVVLSACQTALGGAAGDGTEISGISSYFLKTGRAETVMASLWKVNDTSTSVLMQRFYEFLATGELTKAEALQQAQLSLLYDQDVETRMDAVRASLLAISSETGQPLVSGTPISHPYHWAPFVIIGNAL